jgi:hypothetical protein
VWESFARGQRNAMSARATRAAASGSEGVKATALAPDKFITREPFAELQTIGGRTSGNSQTRESFAQMLAAAITPEETR